MRMIKERFYDKIRKTNSCWIWEANKNNRGYGLIWDKTTQRKELAHRVSYRIHIGEIPKNKLVLHKCDNPGCVNPKQLFLGTHKENCEDKYKKGRANHKSQSETQIRLGLNKGENHPSSRLTEKKIIEIRNKKNDVLKTKEICEEYKISRSHYYAIINRERWAHV